MIELELVERCRRGERSAQHEIYKRTVERLYRLVLRISGNHEDTNEVVQEAYIQAFTRITQFDGRSSFETWLHRVTINQALQNRRRRTLRDRTAASLNGRNSRPPEPLPDQRMDIEDALARLPEADRALLILRYQDGLDYAAIADITGSPPGTVASRLNRARERVRELLKGSYGTPEENSRVVHPMGRSDHGAAWPASDISARPAQRETEP